MSPTSIRLCLAALVLALTACASREPGSLVDHLVAGMTPAQAAQSLGATEASFRVLWETKLDPSDKRPPYSEKTIEGSGLTCLGQRSDIQLSFYLDQLTSVSCYPEDVDSMLAALKSSGHLGSPVEDFELDRGGVRIRGRREPGGRWVVTFTSETLDERQRAWISRYS